jgi:hypothetical protein
MKAFQKLSLAVVVALLVTACSKEVTVDAIPGFNPNIQNPSGPEIPVGRTGVFSQSYQNPYGVIQFQQADASTVQVLRTCTAVADFCAAMDMDPSTNFMLGLNNPASTYTHVVQGNTWITHATGNADRLVFSSTVTSPAGMIVKTVEETYQVSSDPCGYGYGTGLEDRQSTTEGSDGQEWTTDSCQGYF